VARLYGNEDLMKHCSNKFFTPLLTFRQKSLTLWLFPGRFVHLLFLMSEGPFIGLIKNFLLLLMLIFFFYGLSLLTQFF